MQCIPEGSVHIFLFVVLKQTPGSRWQVYVSSGHTLGITVVTFSMILRIWDTRQISRISAKSREPRSSVWCSAQPPDKTLFRVAMTTPLLPPCAARAFFRMEVFTWCLLGGCNFLWNIPLEGHWLGIRPSFLAIAVYESALRWHPTAFWGPSLMAAETRCCSSAGFISSRVFKKI